MLFLYITNVYFLSYHFSFFLPVSLSRILIIFSLVFFSFLYSFPFIPLFAVFTMGLKCIFHFISYSSIYVWIWPLYLFREFEINSDFFNCKKFFPSSFFVSIQKIEFFSVVNSTFIFYYLLSIFKFVRWTKERFSVQL